MSLDPKECVFLEKRKKTKKKKKIDKETFRKMLMEDHTTELIVHFLL